MPDAIFRQGSVISSIDYTPATGDVAAGEVVILGNTAGLTCGVAHLAIPNGTTGSLAVGGGVYDCVALATTAIGAKVYWDNATNKLVATSTNNALFGYMVEAVTAVNTTKKAIHMPFV